MDGLNLARSHSSPAAVSPLLELGAYEAIWDWEGTSFKSISEKFAKEPGSLPSDFVPANEARAAEWPRKPGANGAARNFSKPRGQGYRACAEYEIY